MKVNKKILNLIIIFCLFVLLVPHISALNNKYIDPETNYSVIIEDDAQLLTKEEIDSLLNDMKPLTEQGNIAFKTINQNSNSTSLYASNYYYQLFGAESGTLFLIDMDNRYIYIYSDGTNYNTITQDKANIITDNVYKYASNGDYYKCASETFKQINILLNGGKIMEPMRYISNIIISFISAFVLNFLIVLFSTEIRKSKNKEIIDNCNVTFNIKDVNAVKVGSHKDYSPVSDSSSGGGGGSFGGGGGSFGGGRSSGGGGGHRF